MAKLIDFGNSSHRSSVRSSSSSIRNIYENQLRTIQSSFNTIELNCTSSKPTFDQRDRSVPLTSNEFWINNINTNTVSSFKPRSIRMRHGSLACS